MPPSTVHTCVFVSGRVTAHRAFRKILVDRPRACERPHRLLAVHDDMLLASQEPSNDLALDRQDFRHAVMKETPMRFWLLILAALLTATPAFACPTGYVPCGAGNALCCR